MDKVVQQAAYSAESSAAAAESMNTEVSALKKWMQGLAELVGAELRISSAGTPRPAASSATRSVAARPAKVARQALPAPAVKRKAPAGAAAGAALKKAPARPEDVIPFDNDEFKDF